MKELAPQIHKWHGGSMLATGERVGLILRIADNLRQQHDWDRIDFILSSFGITRSGNDRLEQVVSSVSDDNLIEIALLLGIATRTSTPPAAVSTTVRGARPLFIFASHLSSQRKFLGEVREELELFGITLFVAHDSIPDDAAWQHEIEKALDEADAGMVFLHQGFKESDWCPQEVGWLLGRHVPVVPLNFGVVPYGPLGKLQAGPERSKTSQSLADKVLEQLAKQEPLQDGLAASLVKAMQASGSFNRTDRIWKHLRELECDASLSAELLAAAKTNDQIYRAGSALDEMSYPRAIVAYLRRQPEAEIIKTDIDSYEQFLDEQEQAAERASRRVRGAAEGDPWA